MSWFDPLGLQNVMNNRLDKHAAAYQGDNLYDFDNEILMTWYPQRVLACASGANSLLELGLGHGYTTEIFARKFDRHVVLDGSPAVIRNFRASHAECRAEIVETYFEGFDTEERFDVIVMGFVLEHVDDPQLILRRFRDFLAPGGKMFIAVPNAEVLNRRLGHLAGLLDDMSALSEHDHLLGHKRYYTASSLTAEVKTAGFRMNKLEGIYLKPFTTRQMLSLNLPRNVIDALCAAGVDYPELSCALLAEISAQ
ncbi:MAG: class I SAM-dependent methyltransferase [Pseudomonadales bacterium]